MLKFYHHVDWVDLVDELPDGTPDFTRYAREAQGMLWVLAHQTMK